MAPDVPTEEDAMMLTDGIVGIADDALGPYPHPQRVHYSRLVAWAVEYGLGDRVAWSSILNELTTVEIVKRKKVVHLAGTLAAFKAVHGNRKGKAGRRRRRS
jgi:hypothetical protein